MILRRTLAVCAAVLLIAAFALAMLEPPDMPLSTLLYQMNAGLFAIIQTALHRHLAPWLWERIVLPIMLRPAWLLPAVGGILCAGGATSLAFAGDARPTRRWRG